MWPDINIVNQTFPWGGTNLQSISAAQEKGMVHKTSLISCCTSDITNTGNLAVVSPWTH